MNFFEFLMIFFKFLKIFLKFFFNFFFFERYVEATLGIYFSSFSHFFPLVCMIIDVHSC